MLKSFPLSVSVCARHQNPLVTLDLQVIRVLFPQDQGGRGYRSLSPSFSHMVRC